MSLETLLWILVIAAVLASLLAPGFPWDRDGGGGGDEGDGDD